MNDAVGQLTQAFRALAEWFEDVSRTRQLALRHGAGSFQTINGRKRDLLLLRVFARCFSERLRRLFDIQDIVDMYNADELIQGGGSGTDVRCCDGRR